MEEAVQEVSLAASGCWQCDSPASSTHRRSVAGGRLQCQPHFISRGRGCPQTQLWPLEITSVNLWTKYTGISWPQYSPGHSTAPHGSEVASTSGEALNSAPFTWAMEFTTCKTGKMTLEVLRLEVSHLWVPALASRECQRCWHKIYFLFFIFALQHCRRIWDVDSCWALWVGRILSCPQSRTVVTCESLPWPPWGSTVWCNRRAPWSHGQGVRGRTPPRWMLGDWAMSCGAI